MKCPCCDSEVPYRPIAWDGYLHLEDRKIRCEANVAKMFIRLTKGTVTLNDYRRNNTDAVSISKLRQFLRDANLPYAIPRVPNNNLVYRMVKIHVKNNDASQHSQDVHS